MAALIPHKKAHAFTLLELLVVIAIIAILAALSGVAWQRSSRATHAAKCMQNLRQLGTALVKYVGERDGEFPTLAFAREKITDPVETIDTALKSYITNKDVFRCPADDRGLWEKSGTSYLWNWKLNGQRLAAVRVAFIKKGTIDEPSRIMVLGDKEGFHPHLSNKVNVLYADGHASNELIFIDEAPPEQ